MERWDLYNRATFLQNEFLYSIPFTSNSPTVMQQNTFWSLSIYYLLSRKYQEERSVENIYAYIAYIEIYAHIEKNSKWWIPLNEILCDQ